MSKTFTHTLSQIERHFTATVFIVANEKVLLIFHRKLQKWLPPGGHIEPNEIPPEAAKREALEETGLEIELISDENIWVSEPNARSFERPYFCLLEEVPSFGDKPAHQHIDMIYVGRPIGGSEINNWDETENMRWFTLEEVEALIPEVEAFREIQQVIRKILSPSESSCTHKIIK